MQYSKLNFSMRRVYKQFQPPANAISLMPTLMPAFLVGLPLMIGAPAAYGAVTPLQNSALQTPSSQTFNRYAPETTTEKELVTTAKRASIEEHSTSNDLAVFSSLEQDETLETAENNRFNKLESSVIALTENDPINSSFPYLELEKSQDLPYIYTTPTEEAVPSSLVSESLMVHSNNSNNQPDNRPDVVEEAIALSKSGSSSPLTGNANVSVSHSVGKTSQTSHEASNDLSNTFNESASNLDSLLDDNDVLFDSDGAEDTLSRLASALPPTPSELKNSVNVNSNQPSVNKPRVSVKQQRSLQKLETFYKPYRTISDQHTTPSNQNQMSVVNNAIVSDHKAFHNPSSVIAPNAFDEPLANGDLLDGSVIIDANEAAPLAAPEVFRDDDYDASAHRCEGLWVTPQPSNPSNPYSKKAANSYLGLDPTMGSPLYAVADYGYYDNEDYVELSGHAEVSQNGQTISADQLILDFQRGIAGANGNVVMVDNGESGLSGTRLNGADGTAVNTDSGLIIVADNLAYNTKIDSATATDVAFASVAMQAHGYAGRLNKPDDTHYEMDDVMFSTCPPTNRKWQLDASEIDIDTETGRGEAYNATFRLGNVPVFYLPYFNFPIDDRRASGLLTPNISIDTDSGLKVSLPYYLNLAPNYDATITTDIYTSRNPMINGEFRYLTEDFGQGDLTASFLPNDKEYHDEDRRGLFFQHQWSPETVPNLTAEAVYNYVSDADFLNDFDNLGLSDSLLNLPRRAQVNYYNDYLTTEFKVATYQSLEAEDSNGNRILDKNKPYSRLPQLTIDYRLPTFGAFSDGWQGSALDNVVMTGTSDTAYFKKSINDGSENEKSGLRLYNQLSASYPMVESWGYLTPQVKLQHLYTVYDEESIIDNNINRDDKSQSVLVPEFSIDTGLSLYQAGSPFGWFDKSLGGYQLLTPRAKYIYAPYKNQSKLPNFNTRIASRDYDQLFTDSWFLGHDRLADNNSLALGMNYRFIDAMGVTRFDGSIGEQYHFDNIEVTLDDNDQPFDESASGIAWNSSLQPYRNVWLDFNGALDSDEELDLFSSQVRYQPTPQSLLNFGIIKRLQNEDTNQKELAALTASAIFPVNNNWRVMAQGQFDTDNSRFVDSTLGIDYEDCCYGFSIYGRSYYNDLDLNDDPTQAVMAEFRINGLGNDRSSRLSRLLRNKILGFEPVDALWKR